MEPYNYSQPPPNFSEPMIPQLPEPVAIYTSYDQLPNYSQDADLNAVAEFIKTRFEDKTSWKSHFDAIDNIRVINKYYPSQINNIFVAFGVYILEHLDNHRKTSVFRNCLFLMKEIFQNCREHKLADEIIQKIVPVLLSKMGSEKQLVREEIKAIFEEIMQNCVYESTFAVLCQCCFDKTQVVSETAIKLLARVLSNMGVNLMSLPAGSIQNLFKTLAHILDEKKNLKHANLRTWALEICNYVYRVVGMENFVNFLQVTLIPEEADCIKFGMEKTLAKKESKKSRPSIGEYIRFQRDTGNFKGLLGKTGDLI